jgi:broad specificity phosphatase PhoE
VRNEGLYWEDQIILLKLKKENRMTKIYLVRHGRTAWNREEIFRGTKDIPLDEQGREEARLTGEWLKGEKIDAVYSSPLSRSKETAIAIAGHHGLDVQVLEGLRDINYGKWEGVAHDEVIKQWPELYMKWKNEPHRVVFPEGESLDMVRMRSMDALMEVVSRHPEGTIVLVAHRVVNKVMVAAIIGLDNSHFWRIGQDTGAINSFSYNDGEWIILSVNDTCHLRSIKKADPSDF